MTDPAPCDDIPGTCALDERVSPAHRDYPMPASTAAVGYPVSDNAGRPSMRSNS